MAVDLHAQSGGQGSPVILLHGLFGMGSNLGALARALREQFSVHQLDLPDHGRSGWLERSSLRLMAEAVQQWMRAQGIERAHLCGHSLGGKVAMQLALDAPACVRSLVVADIAPVAYGGKHERVFAAIEAVAAAQCQSRQQAAALMREHLEEEDVLRFLLLSLSRDARGHYQWAFNHRGLKQSYAAYRAAPEAVEGAAYPGPVLFIRGELSDYIREEHRAQILRLFPAAQLRVMAGCGHWLHAQKPELFNRLVLRFLRDKEQA